MSTGSRAQRRNGHKLEATPYDDLPCFNFYRGWRLIQDFYAPVFEDGFNPQRSYVLGYCLDKPRTISEIASMMLIDDAAISNMVKRMQQDGLVTRKRSETDRRSFEIQATEKGAKLSREAKKKFIALNAELEQALSAEDRAFLRHIVRRIHEHINLTQTNKSQ